MHLQSNHVLEGLIRNVEEDHYIREKKYDLLMETLQNKVAGQQKKEQTIQKQNEVAEKAAYELKYSNEKKWRNLLLASKFVYVFLKAKMEKLIGYYEQSELGYQKIKSQTGIENIQEVIIKFRNREQDYQKLVQQINSIESQFMFRKQESQELQQQLEQLQAQQSDENQQEDEDMQGLLKEHNIIVKELGQLYEKERSVEIFLQKIHEFVKRTNHRIGKIEGNNQQFDIETGFTEQFMALSGVIFRQIQNFNEVRAEKTEKEKKDVQDWSPSMIKGEDKLESYTKRNVRVDVFESNVKKPSQNQNVFAEKDYSIQQVDNSFGSDEYLVDVQEKQFLNQLRKEKKKSFENQNKKGKKNK